MQNKTIQKLILAGSIAGFYLTALFAWLTFTDNTGSGVFIQFDYLKLFYYIINCMLLLVIFFLLRKNNIIAANILSLLLVISVFASLFWMVPGYATLDYLQGYLWSNVFTTTVVMGSLSGLVVIPFGGIIPVGLFFIGVFTSIIPIFKYKNNAQS